MNLLKQPLFQKSNIIKDRKYLEWVCDCFKCFICSNIGEEQSSPTQAHHLQGKYRIGAMIRCDSRVIPLCFDHHQILTFKYGERKFWELDKYKDLNPMSYAKILYQMWRENNETENYRNKKTLA